MSNAFQYARPIDELRRALSGVDCDRVDIEIREVRDLDAEELERVERREWREPARPGPNDVGGYVDAWKRYISGKADQEDILALCYSRDAAEAIRRMRARVAKPTSRSRMVDARVDFGAPESGDRMAYGCDHYRSARPPRPAPPQVSLDYDVWRDA